MTVHIHSETGLPMFILDQIMMVDELKKVYEKHGIHGIHYCVLYGWSASPFSTVTSIEIRHEMVYKQVYNNSYYDPIKEDDIVSNRPIKLKDHEQDYLVDALDMTNKLARVPVMEQKILYLTVIDRTKKRLLVEHDPADMTKSKLAGEVEKQLLANLKVATESLNSVILTERDLLQKHDPSASLSDLIMHVNGGVL